MSEAEIVLHISEQGDDANGGSREQPLWSVAIALNKVRWQSYKTARFVIHGSIAEIPAHNAMIDITGKGLPVIFLCGESPDKPGKLNAADIHKRVIYISDGNTLYIEENIVICGGQTQEMSGSGITLENGTVIMRGGEISGNNSGFGMGGGVYVGKNSEFIMEGGRITENTTMMHGGGVFPDEGGIFTMSGGTISKNTAYLGGGGVFVGVGSDFEMTGGSIDGNTSGTEKNMLLGGIALPLGQGGGVYVNPGTTFRMRGGEIVNNRAISMRKDDPDSGSGGGVFVEEGGVFYLEAGKIKKNGVMNWGGGIHTEGSVIIAHDSLICNNVARLGGGGIHIAGEKAGVVMKGGFVMNNYTAGNGGGINILPGGSLVLESGIISDNTSGALGNGLAIEGTALMRGGCILTSLGGLNGAKAGKSSGDEKEKADTDTLILITDTGKLTRQGGEIDGKLTMKDASRFENLRESEKKT